MIVLEQDAVRDLQRLRGGPRHPQEPILISNTSSVKNIFMMDRISTSVSGKLQIK